MFPHNKRLSRYYNIKDEFHTRTCIVLYKRFICSLHERKFIYLRIRYKKNQTKGESMSQYKKLQRRNMDVVTLVF